MQRFCLLLFTFLLLAGSAYSFDKWIVVTTIQYPTEQLKKLAQIPGFRLVVVGDKKTPADWHLDNCDYLSPEKQLELGYEIAKMLPWNHYSRKNIGYLYAIQNGAKIIYETDDDNEPLTSVLKPCSSKRKLPSILCEEACFNVYAYFGRPDVWPRGFPLEKIASCSNYKLTSPSRCNIGVEQGIVNESPDVDAIFRLTQDKNIEFRKRTPCYLPKGIFCPFNSQNTFFHWKAFFTMYLPSSVTMRVSDIWRGYFSQRLLWDFNQQLIFSGPNAVQKRNVHNIFNDFLQEQDLYLKSSKLISFLKDWQNSSPLDPLQAMIDLTQELVKEGFLTSHELSLVEAWVNDLTRIGYKLV